jgi:hypothetical protein
MKKFLIGLCTLFLLFGICACQATQQGADNITNIDEPTQGAEETTTAETDYDKISTYMEEECKNVFSPYYELLNFEILNYQEEAVNGNTEATFFYKLIHKNYDRDPDTVGYIKEAKERGDSHYQQLYDEYLQPQEMNFDLKAIINDDDQITLYSNVSPKGIEWEEVKMSDFIIK